MHAIHDQGEVSGLVSCLSLESTCVRELGVVMATYDITDAVFGSFVPVDKYYIIGKMLAVVLVYMWNFFARKFILYRKVEIKDDNKAEDDTK